MIIIKLKLNEMMFIKSLAHRRYSIASLIPLPSFSVSLEFGVRDQVVNIIMLFQGLERQFSI